MTRRASISPWVLARFVVVILGGILTTLDGEARTAAMLVAAQTATYLIVRLLEAPGPHTHFADVVLTTVALGAAPGPFSMAFAAVPMISLWALARRSPRWVMMAGGWYIAILWILDFLLWSSEGAQYLLLLTGLIITIAISSFRLSKAAVGPHAAAYSLVSQVRELAVERDPISVSVDLLHALRREADVNTLLLQGARGDQLAALGHEFDVTTAATRIPILVNDRAIAHVVSPEVVTMTPAIVEMLNERALALGTALAFADIRSMASDAERSRLAREMHDGIAQEVASLGYAIDDLLNDAPEDMRPRLRELRSDLTRVVSDLRLSIFELRGRDNGVGLGAALSELTDRVQQTVPFRIHLRLDESGARFPRIVEDEILRITSEALTNAKRHAQATHVWISAHLHPPHAEVTIEDDGVGVTVGRQDSFGIQVMHERATEINASLTIRDRLGGGTVVSLVFNPGEIPSRTTAG